MDSDNILFKILEYAWVGIVAVIIHMYRKLVGLDTQHQILQEARTFMAEQRKEDLDRGERQRGEMIETMNSNNNRVLDRLGSLEKAIRNGD